MVNKLSRLFTHQLSRRPRSNDPVCRALPRTDVSCGFRVALGTPHRASAYGSFDDQPLVSAHPVAWPRAREPHHGIAHVPVFRNRRLHDRLASRAPGNARQFRRGVPVLRDDRCRAYRPHHAGLLGSVFRRKRVSARARGEALPRPRTGKTRHPARSCGQEGLDRHALGRGEIAPPGKRRLATGRPFRSRDGRRRTGTARAHPRRDPVARREIRRFDAPRRTNRVRCDRVAFGSRLSHARISVAALEPARGRVRRLPRQQDAISARGLFRRARRVAGREAPRSARLLHRLDRGRMGPLADRRVCPGIEETRLRLDRLLERRADEEPGDPRRPRLSGAVRRAHPQGRGHHHHCDRPDHRSGTGRENHRRRQSRHGRARARLSLGPPLGLACGAGIGRDAANPAAIPARAPRSPRGCSRRTPAEQGLKAESPMGAKKKPTKPQDSNEELRRWEERFESLIDLSSEWYWEQDEEWRFTLVKGSAAGHGGIDTKKFLGTYRWDRGAVPVGDGGSWDKHKAALKARQPFTDFLFKRPDSKGGMRYISTSGQPIVDDKGRFRGYRGIAKDITDARRAQELQSLEHSVAHSIAAAESVTAAMTAAIRAICETEGWECGRYFRPDSEAGVLRLDESWGIQDPAIQEFLERSREIVYRPGVGLMGRVWQSGQPLWVADLTRDSRVQRAASGADAGIRGGFVFPVRSEGKVIGVLGFNSRQVRETDEGLLKAILAIGSQIGQFLERKRAEEEQRRFRAAMDASADLMLLIDPTSLLYVDVNDAACRALGYSREELLTMGPPDIFSTSREELAQLYERMIAGELIAPTVKGHYRRKDGSQLPVEAYPRAVRTGEGHVIVSIARDISERLASEETLSRFRVAMDNSADMVVLIDRTTMRFVDVNETACRLLGYSREELLKMGPQDVLPTSREELEGAYDEFIATPSHTHGMRSQYRCKDGSTFPFESTRHVLRSGDAYIIAAISRDVRERLASENALRESEERFRSLTQLSTDMYWEQDDQFRFTSMSGM